MLAWIFVAFAGFFVLESVLPGWRMPRVRTWPARVIAINVVQLAVVLLAGISWERWFRRASIFGLHDALSGWAAGMGAYFIATFEWAGRGFLPDGEERLGAMLAFRDVHGERESA